MTKFKKGKSGNKKGRPKGVPDKRTKLRELLEPHSVKLVNKVVKMALGGDTTALRLCLERLIAPVKSEPVVIKNLGESLAEKGNAIMGAIASGQIEVTTGSALMQSLVSLAKVVEVSELEERVKMLEEKKNGS